MPQNFNRGVLPGPSTTYVSDTRIVILSDEECLARGVIIDGSESRDPTNTGDIDYLQAGLLLGQITATGLYSPAIIGPLTAAYSAAGSLNVQMTVAVATATEIVRRIGSSGTFTITGPPSAAGTVATETVTYSAVNTTTGVITVTAASANYISGSFVGDTDGSQTPLLLIGNGSPVKVTDADDNSVDVDLARAAVGGYVDSSQIINWPSDTSLINWVKDSLNSRSGSRFTFDDAYI